MKIVINFIKLKFYYLLLFFVTITVFTIFVNNNDGTLFRLKELSASSNPEEFYQYIEKNLSHQNDIYTNYFILNYYTNHQENIQNGYKYKKLIINKAFQILDTIFEMPLDTPTISKYTDKCINNIYGTGNQKDWIKCYDLYFVKINQFFKSRPNELAILYSYYSMMFSMMGNIEKSQQLIELAKNMVVNSKDKLAYIYSRLGLNYYNNGNFLLAIQNYKTALELADLVNDSLVNKPEWNSVLGESYNAISDSNGKYYTEKGLNLYLKTSKIDTGSLFYYFQAVGESYLINNDLKKSKEIFYKCLEFSPNEESIYKFLATVYLKEGDFTNSHKMMDSCYKLYNYYPGTNFNQLKKLLNFDNYILQRSDIYLAQYQTTDNLRYLKKAEECFDQIRQLSLLNIANFHESKNKLSNYKRMIDNNSKSLEILYQLYKKEKNTVYLLKMLDVSEMNKNLLLYFSLQRQNYTSNIPKELSDKELKIKSELIHLENKIFEQGSSESLLNSKLQKTIEYDSILKRIKSFEINSNLYVPTQVFENIKNKIDNHTTIIEYAFTQNYLFVFVLNKDKLTVKKIDRNDYLDSLLTNYEQFIKVQKLSDVNLNKAKLVKNSTELYQKLISPIKTHLNKNVVFILENQLNGIPFEALITELPSAKQNFNTYKYLIHQHTIQYAFSAAMMIRPIEEKLDFKKKLLVVAPFVDENKTMINNYEEKFTFGKLKNSYLEAKVLYNIFGGDTLIGVNASKENFLSHLTDYQYIHLASHSVANRKSGEFSFVVFSKSDNNNQQVLFANEIYPLKLNTDLIVLSSCESGAGEELKGEGYNSISRAFAYTGVKNIVNSLWKVNDQHTQKLMVAFYNNLKLGLNKAEALQKAKIEFIQSEKLIGAHPFYWASFKLFSNQ